MTEDDLKQLDAEALQTPTDPVLYEAWRLETLTALKKQEQDLMAGYRLSRYLRDDARLQALVVDLKNVRAALTYLAAPVSE